MNRIKKQARFVIDENRNSDISLIVKVITLLLILVVISQLVNLYNFVKSRYDTMSTDPLVYGARIYNITDCTCYLTDYATLNFNQHNSTTTIKQRGIEWGSLK